MLASVIKDVTIYAAANSGTAILALLLVPLYSYKLSPSEFGVYSLVVTLYGLLAIFSDGGMTNAFARYYFDGTNSRSTVTTYRERLLSTGLSTTAATSLVLSSACYIGGDFVARAGFGGAAAPFFRIVAATLFFAGISTVPMIYLRVARRASAYSLLRIMQMLAFLVFNIFFVAELDLGVSGILYSQLLSTGILAIAALAIVVRDVNVSPRFDIACDLFKFGVPFLPVLLLMWVVDVSDRYLIEQYVSLQDVGIYSLGYRLGQAMMIFVTAFTLGWSAICFKIHQHVDAAAIYARVTVVYLAGAGFLWLSMSLAAGHVVYLISPQNFHGAATFIPPVAFAYVLYGLFVLSTTGMGIAKRTGYLPWVTLCAALVNLVPNIILIPRFGALVAAYTTVAAYTVLAGGSLWISQRFYPVPHRYWQWSLLLGAIIVLAVLAELIPVLPVFADVSARVLIVACYVALVMKVGVVQSTELYAARDLLRSAVGSRVWQGALTEEARH